MTMNRESDGNQGKTIGHKTLSEKLSDLIFPQHLYCGCCGNIIDETRKYGLCDHCLAHFGWNTDGLELIDGMAAGACLDYGIYERTLIFGLKYKGRKYLARDIAAIMADKVCALGLDKICGTIVPVPLHRSKERKRGFNQAALIGKHLARLTGMECIPDMLIRTRDTAPMRSLGPAERKWNIEGGIAFNEKYASLASEKRVLLIDDFYTTGSTALECRRALNSGGVTDVTFLAFAARRSRDTGDAAAAMGR